MSPVVFNSTVQQKEDSLALARRDIFLCASNIVSVASKILVDMGLNGLLPTVIRELSPLVVAVGELIVAGQQDTKMEIFTKLALIYSRIAILKQVEKISLLKPLVFVGYALGTVGIIKRAFEEINKSLKLVDPKGENNLKIARNVFVHGVNATAASYRTVELFGSVVPFSSIAGLTGEPLMDKILEIGKDNSNYPFLIKESLCPESAINNSYTRCYRDLAKQVHPDKFHAASAELKEKAGNAFAIVGNALGVQGKATF